MTIPAVVAILLTFGINQLQKRVLPAPHPRSVVDFGGDVLFFITACVSFFGVVLYPTTIPFRFLGAGLLILAVLPPIAGYIESRYSDRGATIGFLGSGRRPGGRFWPHLLTNVAGAAVATALVWATRRIDGLQEYASADDSSAVLVNLLLPLAYIVILAFTRTQQIEREPSIDQRIDDHQPWPDDSLGFSLKSWNQPLNVVHLMVATYLAASGALVLFGLVISNAKHGSPVEFSSWIGIAMIAGIAFLLACGLPNSSTERTVYLTFATGTPVALGASLLALALMANTRERDIFAVVFLIATCIVYSALVVWNDLRGRPSASPPSSTKSASWRSGPAPHYFASTLVAFVVLIEVLLIYTTS